MTADVSKAAVPGEQRPKQGLPKTLQLKQKNTCGVGVLVVGLLGSEDGLSELKAEQGSDVAWRWWLRRR